MRKSLTCTLIILSLFGCERFDEEVVNLNNGRVDVIGHGGSGFGALYETHPPNSSIAIERALDGLHADGVEVDVQMSSDGVLYLYHDERLESMTHCTSCIGNQLSSDLDQCHYAWGINDNLSQDQALLRLKGVLETYINRSNPPEIYLDIKAFNFCAEATEDLQRFAQELHDAITAVDGFDHVIVGSRGVALLTTLKSMDARIRTVLDVDDIPEGIEKAVPAACEGLVISYALASKQEVQNAHQAGLKVTFFGVRGRRSCLEALKMHPDAIQTDNIELLQQILY